MNKKDYEKLRADITNATTYLKYVRTQVKRADGFDEDELQKLHKVYVTLSNAYGKFSGSDFKINLVKIIESNLSQTDKYNKYRSFIIASIDDYNSKMSSRPDKQIIL